MPEIYIYICVFIGFAMFYLYGSIVKLPVILFLFLSIYNTAPYASYYFFGGDIYFADYRFIDYAFQVFTTGLVAYYLGCLSVRCITKTIQYNKNPSVAFVNLKITSYIVSILVLSGVILTGQINHLGSYGAGDPAHTKFATLLHFTLIFNIMFAIYIYLLTCGIDKKYIKYQTWIVLILFLVIGNRSVIMGIVLSSAWYISTNKSNVLRDIILIFILFIVLVFVQTFRGAGHITGDWLEGVFVVFDRFADKDIWIYLLSIQSDNFGVLAYTIGKMEVMDYFYGYTYLESLVRLIPGFLRRIAGINDEGEIFNHIEFLGYDGLAFSLMAEIYMNFGHGGVIFIMFIIGLGVGYLSDMSDRKRGFYTVFMLSMYPVISTLARNDSALSIKQFIYTVVIIGVILLITQRKDNSRDVHEN